MKLLQRVDALILDYLGSWWIERLGRIKYWDYDAITVIIDYAMALALSTLLVIVSIKLLKVISLQLALQTIIHASAQDTQKISNDTYESNWYVYTQQYVRAHTKMINHK